ncbi:hypothetical protein HMP0721_2029 [Pseudoramibacter alactolyticus ATCC 23263]|jgi:hypothetical protein|uniref:Uncharacterized protein n=1 Tax=Pseudoramibacter alactolyticus ATCC 23263 TaxID=887929 RepID=E6MJ44_9FIRM|nr:hypothetical protein HMP0721_2029 [Pseudoramibacter alactolyticus ATCC 23263]
MCQNRVHFIKEHFDKAQDVFMDHTYANVQTKIAGRLFSIHRIKRREKEK